MIVYAFPWPVILHYAMVLRFSSSTVTQYFLPFEALQTDVLAWWLLSLCRYHRMERSSQYIRRSVRMPETANLDQIKAKYDNGILQLNIPKKEVERHRQRVDVQ